MKKKLTLWILALPFLAFAQNATYKNGTLTIDFGKKKNKTQDSTQQQQYTYPTDDDDDDSAQVKKKRVYRPPKETEPKGERPDYARNGLFQLLFHGGINACQVDNDGDVDPGFTYPGAEFGIGTMIKVHRILAVSMELNYTMKGEKQGFSFDSATIANSRQQFRLSWDYIEVPLALNVYTVPYRNSKLMFFHLGFAPAVNVRFKEISGDGQNITSSSPQPNRFELSTFAALYFVIAQKFAVGAKFEYGLTRADNYYPLLAGVPRLLGDHNILLNLDFMYIMNAVKKKKG